MPQIWVPTVKRRLMLKGMDFLVRVTRGKPSASAERDAERVSRILVVEPKNIGDVVLAIPFLAQLRARFPGARTTLLAAPNARLILQGTGLVDDFIETHLDWSEKSTRYNPFGYNWRELLRLKRELRGRDFDLAFNCCMQIRERVVIGLSGARRRVAYAFGEGDSVLTDAISVQNSERHKVDDWLRLLEPFGGVSSVQLARLHVEESERAWAKGYLASRGIPKDNPLVGIHPGASLAEKRWPLERFREVAVATAAQPGIRVLAIAEPSGYGSELFAIPGVVGAQVGLRELIALIERCDLLVCNDSGPMHIAGALGVPTVAVFGAGIEQWFAPLGEGHEMLRPDRDEQLADQASLEGDIRAPRGIRSSRVLDAVGRAVQRLRARGTFSRV
jgi:ADP-heptose:LPS heptosyltransferase